MTGDRRAVEEFFNLYARRLGCYAARRSGLDAASLEDVVQNSMIKAVGNLGHFRGEAPLFAWLSGICRRELADIRRKGSRRPVHVSLVDTDAVQEEVAQLRAPEQLEPAAVLESLERRAAVLRVMESLPANYAIALEAKYGDGDSVEDIARLLGVSTVAAQSVLARARVAFRESCAPEANSAATEGEYT